MLTAWRQHRRWFPVLVGAMLMPLGFVMGTPGAIWATSEVIQQIREILRWYHEVGGGPGFTIDLIQWVRPKGEVKRPLINDIPSAHYAFGVRDLQATHDRLKAAGAEFVSPPVVFPEEEGGWRVLFFRDPDGFLLELIQIPE